MLVCGRGGGGVSQVWSKTTLCFFGTFPLWTINLTELYQCTLWELVYGTKLHVQTPRFKNQKIVNKYIKNVPKITLLFAPPPPFW